MDLKPDLELVSTADLIAELTARSDSIVVVYARQTRPSEYELTIRAGGKAGECGLFALGLLHKAQGFIQCRMAQDG